jgi:hypothetical protein
VKKETCAKCGVDSCKSVKKETCAKCGVDSCKSSFGVVVGSCEPEGFRSGREFTGYLNSSFSNAALCRPLYTYS